MPSEMLRTIWHKVVKEHRSLLITRDGNIKGRKIQLISCMIYFAEVRDHVKLKRKKIRTKIQILCVFWENV